ncbi:KorB DNA-binding domain-like [Ralstonia solanacearum]|uniref:KorB DNA-binding domain-like n=1 Tax=Ralstonia solanacearum TaxID=305 RepID=UPI0001D95049|nr:KorB DNA-binding domain-like [Ralstonia solanacearum]CBJ49667.1 hypothethical protein, KorB DNA-binding domain-like [Ralstonia solanacearum PSI07]
MTDTKNTGSVAAQLAALPNLPMPALWALWDRHFPRRPSHLVTPLDAPLMRALGLAHYWQRLLDEQRVVSMIEIAAAEGIDVTQVRRLLRLTLLAPEIVEQLIISPKAKLEPVIRCTWSTDWYSQGKAIVSSRATRTQ